MNTELDRAIEGIITSFEDALSLQGKSVIARQIGPHLRTSFKETGSILYRLLDTNPSSTEAWISYASYSPSLRRKGIAQE
jgi:hypothetical protein